MHGVAIQPKQTSTWQRQLNCEQKKAIRNSFLRNLTVNNNKQPSLVLVNSK